jgi:hypothetical protein
VYFGGCRHFPPSSPPDGERMKRFSILRSVDLPSETYFTISAWLFKKKRISPPSIRQNPASIPLS